MRIDQRDGFIWINGEFVDWKEAKVHVMTHSLHYGTAAFEGERCYDGKVFKMREHHERLLNSAKIMDLPLKYTVEQLDDIVLKTLEKNNLKNSYIRPLIWRGSENCSICSQESSVNLMVATYPWESFFDKDILEKGVSLCVGDWFRPDPKTAPVSAKASCVYGISCLCKNKARDKGFDDALMLDYRGYIAESSGSNIFFVINGEIHTPEAHAFLNGITRQTIIELAREKGYKVVERNIELQELSQVEEAFLTGTAAEITPIGRIEDKVYNVGRITMELRDAYLKLVNG
jgi:branched-chain amino acid aminotransferase